MAKCRHDYRSDGRSYCYCIKCGQNKYEKGCYFKKESKQMAKISRTIHKTLQNFITSFAIEIGYEADKEKFNKAWDKLWCRIEKLGLFNE